MLLGLFLLSISALGEGAECPPPGNMFYLIPHEYDCTKFYICSHGKPVLQTCPEGTHFNPTFMVCQSPAFARCSTEPPASEFPCPWPGSIAWQPHPHSCSKYYVCEHGVAKVFDCPTGLEYSEELKQCVWPHESNCKSQNDAPHRPEASQDGGLPQDGACEEGALSANEDCGKYICSRGVAVAIDCPADLLWNSKLERCVWPRDSDCANEAQSDVQQNGGDRQNGGCVEGALSSSKDCSKYNVCSHGKLVSLDCPRGLHWNSEMQSCDWPLSTGCV